MITTKQHILNTLAYFDIFQYPLLKEEIHRFHGQSTDAASIDEAIISLTEEQFIFRVDEFYALHNERSLAARRRLGNQLAAEQMKTAQKAAKILSRFPYVRGLAISGSLSKNYSTEKTDIDFFIITSANRLWIARTLMHLYKKLTFLNGRQKWFCMNYYVDRAGLEIEEKNIFTAMEIATLIPMHGKMVLDDFKLMNKWIRNYFPAGVNNTDKVPEIKKRWLGKLIEGICNNRFGNWLDDRLMKITRGRWNKKEQQQMKNDNGFVLGMMVNKHYSKPNPAFFQYKVVEMYKVKLDGLPKLMQESFKTG